MDGPAAELLFFPYLRAVNQAATGAIAGTVYGATGDFGVVPVGGGTISVFRGDTASPPGTWSLAATAPVDTANTEMLMIALNQRATFRWVAAPGGELMTTALALNGIMLNSVGSTGTPNCNATIHWME